MSDIVCPNDLDAYADQLLEQQRLDTALVIRLLRAAANRWRESEDKLEVYRQVEREGRLGCE